MLHETRQCLQQYLKKHKGPNEATVWCDFVAAHVLMLTFGLVPPAGQYFHSIISIHAGIHHSASLKRIHHANMQLLALYANMLKTLLKANMLTVC